MDRIELEPSSGSQPVADLRRHMDEPPPVRLVAVEDVHRPMLPGLIAAMDRFYCDLWEFSAEPGDGSRVYRAENVRLIFTTVIDQKPIERDTVRAQGIVVRSLRDAERKLAEAEIEFIRQRGLMPGEQSLLCQDPSGNWIEVFEAVPIA